jgi:hypothetical protein
MKKFKDVKFKVAFHDEAVTTLFSQSSQTRDSKDAQLLFKIKRACSHFDILIAPSFWDLVPDIRERRARSLIYTYVDIVHPAPGRTEYVHKFAYFSRQELIALSTSMTKTKKAFSSHHALFALVSPQFKGTFPPMCPADEAAYLAMKHDHMSQEINRIFDADVGRDIQIVENNLDFSDFDKKHLQKKDTSVTPVDEVV